MKITALVENTSNCELRSAHGLALYIETPRHKLLFDLGPDASKYHSPTNDSFYAGSGLDRFDHEQDLMVTADRRALIIGCGHCGVVNILERTAQYRPEMCVGGYHLWNPMSRRTAPEEVLSGIAGVLAQDDMDFYTCHCTGRKAFRYLSGHLPRMHYLSCGETIE